MQDGKVHQGLQYGDPEAGLKCDQTLTFVRACGHEEVKWMLTAGCFFSLVTPV